MMHRTYLGDSVYAELNEAGQIVLTTENGMGASNTIYLEAEVYLALTEWAEPDGRDAIKQDVEEETS